MAADGKVSPQRKAAISSPARSACEGRGVREDNADLGRLVSSLPSLDRSQLLLQWRNHLGGRAPAHLPTWLLARVIAYRLQAAAFGDLKPAMLRKLKLGDPEDQTTQAFANRSPATRDGVELKPGSILTREWRGRLERVTVMQDGFAWNGATYGSLSMVSKAITGTSWNGHRFFGLMSGRQKTARHAGRAGDAFQVRP